MPNLAVKTSDAASNQNAQPTDEPVDALAAGVGDLALQNEGEAGAPPTQSKPARPPYTYTRSQALFLHKSPLVRVPEGMPELKYWFGDWNEQHLASTKKDSENTAVTNGNRERRFRRDADDGDGPARPTFRSGLSQPSQMGNFKHQPIRGDRDRDLTRERERDLRDKDGQERLRSVSGQLDQNSDVLNLRQLSDKYDRERLSIGSASAIRGKERELAPHLNSASSSRTNGQASSTRRAEGREPREAGKRRAGESSDDWRRDPVRSRDERSDNTRGDRDDKERPRSRARNSSKSRRDPSTARGGRDRDEKERDEGRDRDRRRGDREDRKDRDEHPRRTRDAEREDDDGRHWRDDGRRDERVTARRDRDKDSERDRERWDRNGDKSSRNEADRSARDKDRWDTEDRDGRPKRSSGRERKAGTADPTKEKDDGKEKEPAWMETYVPSSSNAGILGGKGVDGELDELQAWKKTMKEREQKTAAATNGSALGKAESTHTEKEAVQPTPSAAVDGALDEIQQFKLIMKKAQEEKQDSPSGAGAMTPSGDASTRLGPILDAQGPPPGIKKDPLATLSSVATSSPVSALSEGLSVPSISSSATSPHPSNITSPSEPAIGALNTPDTLLALLGSSASRNPPVSSGPLTANYDDLKPAVSRMFPNAGPAGESRLPTDPAFSSASGSRVLSMGSRSMAQKNSGLPPHFSSAPLSQQSSQSTPSAYSPSPSTGRHTPSQFQEAPIRFNAEDIIRERPGSQQAMAMYHDSGHLLPDRATELGLLSQMADRRMAAGSPISQFPDVTGQGIDYSGAGGLSQSKAGSRFAKLWDSEARGRPGHGGPSTQGSMDLNSYPGMQRLEHKQFNDGLRDNIVDERVASQLQAIMNGTSQRNVLAHHANPGSFSVNYPTHHPHHQQQPMHHQGYPMGGRQEFMHDQLMEDRGFVADGLVPGLRNAPLPRGRDPQGYLGDQLGDSLQYGGQRLPPPSRGLEHMLPGGGRGLAIQQNQFGRGPSPITAGIPGGQRLPAGLANLGSRPPHDPGQFMGSGLNSPSQGFGGQSPVYGNVGGGMGYGGGPQMRGPHQLQNALGGQNNLGGLGMQNNMDLRANQAQLLGLGGGMNGIPPGVGRGVAGYGPQQQLMGGRGLQQQHLPASMSPGMMQSPHAQQSGGTQTAHHDALVALLMGRRD